MASSSNLLNVVKHLNANLNGNLNETQRAPRAPQEQSRTRTNCSASRDPWRTNVFIAVTSQHSRSGGGSTYPGDTGVDARGAAHPPEWCDWRGNTFEPIQEAGLVAPLPSTGQNAATGLLHE
jgi:hypothetical protein